MWIMLGQELLFFPFVESRIVIPWLVLIVVLALTLRLDAVGSILSLVAILLHL